MKLSDLSENEQKVINYLETTCILGGGQPIYNIEEYGLEDKFSTKEVSKIMQGLKRKGLVSYVSDTRVWIMNKYMICKRCQSIMLLYGYHYECTGTKCGNRIHWRNRNGKRN